MRRPTAKVVKRKKRYVRRVEASMEGTLLGCGSLVGVIGPFGSRWASAKKFCAVFPNDYWTNRQIRNIFEPEGLFFKLKQVVSRVVLAFNFIKGLLN